MGQPQPHPYTHNTVDNKSTLLLIISFQVNIPGNSIVLKSTMVRIMASLCPVWVKCRYLCFVWNIDIFGMSRFGEVSFGKRCSALIFHNFRVYEDIPEEEIESGKWELLSWACEPGDVIAFQGLTLHGAPGNLSFNQRRILSTR